MNIAVTASSHQITAMKEDIDGAKSHADRLTKIETRLEVTESARIEAARKEEEWKKRNSENSRWVIGMAVGAVSTATIATVVAIFNAFFHK